MTKQLLYPFSCRAGWTLLAAALTALALTGSALATDRYVNSGASCPGSGTLASPYCSFSSINSLDLAPGDRVLLARGATFNVSTDISLKLGDEDDGSAVAWNSVEPYGSGADPVITGANVADTYGITGNNIDYWKFVEIEFKNASKGFQIIYKTLSHTGLRFDKLYIHDMLDTGPQTGRTMDISVAVTNPPVPGPTQWVLKDVQVTDSEFSYLSGGSIDAINSLKREAFQDILLMRNYSHDLRGGIFGIRYTTNVKWISNREERVETASVPSGNTDLHLWAMLDTTFVNSIFDYVYDSGSHDQTFFDIAYRIDQFRLRNSLIEEAAGAGIEWHPWRITDDYGLDSALNSYTDQEISGNSWRNNGWDTTPNLPSIFEGSMSLNHAAVGACSTLPTGTVSENLYWEPTVFFNTNGCPNSLSVTNNTSITASADISYAAQVFSDAGCSTSPWSYESSTDGFTWTAMTTLQTVNPGTDVRCKPSAASVPWVSRFEQFPNTGSFSVARTWTAPSTGTVSIRSRALKAELGGDGVLVRVRKNSGADLVAQLTLGANDQVGVVLNVDSVPVVAGDKIRFEVDDIANSTSDRISWSPVVAYRPSGGNLAPSATTSASSTDPSYCACRVNDLQTTDYNGWTSLDGVMPEWVQLTWGSAQMVSRVEFDTTGANPTRDFQIQYWTGSAWVTPAGASITGNTAKHRTISFPVVSTTQLRVYVTLGDPGGGYARVDELAVYSDAGSNPNLGPSASATSASSTDPAYCACRINDGITTAFNGWTSGDNGMPEWVQMDWTSSKTVASVVLYTTPGYVVRDFQVQYWNGSTWVTPSGASITGNTQEVRTVSFTAVSTTKIRVNVTLGDAATGYARVDELGVYATANPNLGPSASATSASSTYPGYCECRINDGNIADFNGWTSGDTTMPEWVQMDWASSQTVGRVEIYSTSGLANNNFQVQYWNGVAWLTPPNGSIINNTAKHRTAIFPAVAMTKLRVYVTWVNPGYYARVDELEAYLS